jgi:hypothetical protein
MTSDLPDFSAYCEAACVEYWGEPDRKNFKELCWGRRDGYGGRSYDIKKKRWYDADAKRGGSTLQLIAIEEGFTKADGKADTRGKNFFDVWRIGHEKKIIAEPPPEAQAKIRKAFRYTDEQDQHLYDVVRFDTEDRDARFRYRLPSGEWKLGKTRRVLYRLPALIAAIKAQKLILVCEGEKDTETAVALGYEATTNCGGVGKWRGAYDKFFANADVVIVADNDQHGRGQEHAADVAVHLRKIARQVRVVMFPQKDLTEWVTAGGDRAALDALIEQASVDGDRAGKKKKPRAKADNVAAVKRDQGAALLSDVGQFLKRFVAYPSEHTHIAHVLWTAHTHLMEAWDSTPRLAFLSPEPGSGKTRSLEVTELLVPDPVAAVNVTPAYMFRKCGSEDGSPTILFDEIDTVFGAKAREHEELRALLNSGHRRGATAGRCVVRGRIVETEEISSYAAVAVAGLGWLPDTILSRSIIVRMRRRAPDEKIEPFRRRVHAPQGENLRQRLAGWASTILAEATEARPEMPAGVEDRDADVWEALLAIADIAGGDWPKRARAAATALVKVTREEEPSLGIRLLADLRLIFGETAELATREILQKLIALDEAPWGNINGKEVALDARGLANHLRPFGVKSGTVRISEKDTPKGYKREDLVDVWRRYLPPLSSPKEPPHPPQAPQTPETPVDVAADVADVADDVAPQAPQKPPPKSPKTADVADVADVADLRGNGEDKLVCQHCGAPERPGEPVLEVWVEGEPYLLHRGCQKEWLGEQL